MTTLLSASVKERLGAEVRSLTPEEYGKYGLKRQQGVVVVWIDPNGPLGHAGFEIEDVILAINGRAIGDVEELAGFLSAIQPGQRIVLLALDHRTGKTGYAQLVVR